MKKCKCGCGKEVKEDSEYVRGHYSIWKANQDKKPETHPPIQSPPPVQNNSWLGRLNSWYGGRFPKKLLSTEQIKELKLNNIEPLTDEQKFIRFFGGLGKWTANKPGRIAKYLAQKRTGNGFDVKHVVFVSETEEPKQAYIPYNPVLGVLFAEDNFYDTPINGKEPIFLDKDKFAPLINRKKYTDDFDLPEDFASSLINIGIGYGRLSQFKDLISKINQAITIQTLSYIAIIAMVIGIVLITYIQNKHYVAVETQLAELVKVINAGKGV